LCQATGRATPLLVWMDDEKAYSLVPKGYLEISLEEKHSHPGRIHPLLNRGQRRRRHPKTVLPPFTLKYNKTKHSLAHKIPHIRSRNLQLKNANSAILLVSSSSIAFVWKAMLAWLCIVGATGCLTGDRPRVLWPPAGLTLRFPTDRMLLNTEGAEVGDGG